MPPEITVLIAGAQRLAAVRDGLPLPGRVLVFSTSNLASAFDSIRTYQAQLVVLDALFSPTPEGRAFSDRVRNLAIPAGEIRLVALVKGVWTVTRTKQDRVAPADVQLAGLNTRRAPRFRVVDPLQAVIEGNVTNLVNVSVFGAQVVSEPLLRPNQRIRVTLPDTEDTLRLTAQVAWSVFEKSKPGTDPYYRAGMEFNGTTIELLEDYCRRHCDANPLPLQGL